MDYLFNAYDYFRPGGPIMVLLLVISLWMWFLVFERLIAYWEIDRQDANLKEAVLLLGHGRPTPTATGMCRQLVSGYLQARTGESRLDGQILKQQAMRQLPRIRRSLPTITILAATAPLMGLLGTVTGMVETFDVIALFGTGNAKALSGGISQALITTQSGLLVGIPGFFMSRLLSRRAQAIERRLSKIVIALKREI